MGGCIEQVVLCRRQSWRVIRCSTPILVLSWCRKV